MTIQELREKRSKAWDTARDFLDSKRNESGLLSEEDSVEDGRRSGGLGKIPGRIIRFG